MDERRHPQGGVGFSEMASEVEHLVAQECSSVKRGLGIDANILERFDGFGKVELRLVSEGGVVDDGAHLWFFAAIVTGFSVFEVDGYHFNIEGGAMRSIPKTNPSGGVLLFKELGELFFGLFE